MPMNEEQHDAERLQSQNFAKRKTRRTFEKKKQARESITVGSLLPFKEMTITSQLIWSVVCFLVENAIKNSASGVA